MSESGVKVGKLCDRNAQRDAIHVAILPVVAGDDHMWPGSKIRLVYGSNEVVKGNAEYGNADGIVDPYLETAPRKGERFYMWMMPNTITGLRHDWTHPKVDASFPTVTNEHEEWLRQFADDWNFSYDELIAQASSPNKGGRYDRYIVAQGIDLHSAGDLGDGVADEFWKHLEALTEQKYGDDHRQSFGWSCTC